MPFILQLIASRLGVSEAGAKLISFGLIGLLVAAAVGWHAVSATIDTNNRIVAAHDAGVTEGRAAEREAWQTAANLEHERQAKANAEAIAAAAATAAELRQERDKLTRQVEDLNHAADSDSHRDDVVFGADSLRRLNGLR